MNLYFLISPFPLSENQFSDVKFVLLVGIISFSLYSWFRSHFFRGNDGSKTIKSENFEILKQKLDEELRPEIETESKSKHDFRNYRDEVSKKEETENSFKFKFPSYDEFCMNKIENEEYQTLERDEGLSEFTEETEIEALSSDGNSAQDDLKSKGSDEELFKETNGESEYQGEKEDQNLRPSESESFFSSPLGSVSNLINSYSDGFLSDNDFGNGLEFVSVINEMPGVEQTLTGLVSKEDIYKTDDVYSKNVEKVHPEFEMENDICSENENDIYTTGDDACSKNVEKVHPEFQTDNDICGQSKNDSKIGDLENKSDSEKLREHKELIEQSKMELKKARHTGLPTILEELESPKISEDLKPWKISKKLIKADRTGELQKFYKIYREKMRKLDILNYQKMYAIGFLHFKGPIQPISSQKSPVPPISTLLSHSLFPCKRKIIGHDPMMNFIIGLQSDLEIVYVGQMCLSWEILHWQYDKALELWELDPHGVRIYNEVAGDFQQFQVLLQRFIEDESFQGPRVQNYVKSRCALRNLLQVPLIKEYNAKDRKKALKRQEMGEFAITSDTVVEILEESIRIFWSFLGADKDCSNMVLKSPKSLRIELQDPADSKLLVEVQANLRKKEKKLKGLLRGGNCILNKFKKREEDDLDQSLYFFSQVDMKLVGRVLNMPRIRADQLIWCRDKLQKISFVSNKIVVEPTFLLFPC